MLVEPQLALRDALVTPQAAGEPPLQLIAGISRSDDGKRRTELGRKALSALEPHVVRLVEAYDEARERFPLAFPGPSEGLVQRANHLLDATADATRERVRHLVRPFDSGRQPPWHALHRAMRAREHDPLCRPRGRFRRAASALGLLGFERHLGRCLRLEPAPLPIPHSKLIARAVPGDIRIVHPEHTGILYELSAHEGLGRAFGMSLCKPSLPWALSRPIAGGPGSVLGGLLVGWMGEPIYLERVLGLSGRAKDRLAEHAALVVVLATRWAAARIATPVAGPSVRQRLEVRAEALSRAVCCDVPPVVAGILWPGHRAGLSEGFGRLLGLALHVALRERFDEDHFRNPRAADSLRELAEPGGLSDPEAFTSALGASEHAASDRVLELLSR